MQPETPTQVTTHKQMVSSKVSLWLSPKHKDRAVHSKHCAVVSRMMVPLKSAWQWASDIVWQGAALGALFALIYFVTVTVVICEVISWLSANVFSCSASKEWKHKLHSASLDLVWLFGSGISPSDLQDDGEGNDSIALITPGEPRMPCEHIMIPFTSSTTGCSKSDSNANSFTPTADVRDGANPRSPSRPPFPPRLAISNIIAAEHDPRPPTRLTARLPLHPPLSVPPPGSPAQPHPRHRTLLLPPRPPRPPAPAAGRIIVASSCCRRTRRRGPVRCRVS
jgi:hypothetical protein